MTMFIYYTDQAMVKALDTFRCPEITENNPWLSIKGLRFLFRFNKDTPYRVPSRKELVEHAKSLFDKFIRKKQLTYAREIADIVSMYYPSKQSYFFERLDQKEEIKPPPKIIKTVYDDKQNVHNSKINQTVINSAIQLCKDYYLPEEEQNHVLAQIEGILINKYPKHRALIIDFIHYLRENTSTFGSANITLAQTFISLWLFIVDHNHRQDLELRLLEELKDMNGQCSTGHVARLINVVQGYTDKYTIQISNHEQCKAVISQYLTNILSECKDERILDGILDGNDEFVKYIREKVSLRLLEWKETYGADSLNRIAKTINSYCGTEVFK